MENRNLDLLKEHYGEKMVELCSELENVDNLYELVSEIFAEQDMFATYILGDGMAKNYFKHYILAKDKENKGMNDGRYPSKFYLDYFIEYYEKGYPFFFKMNDNKLHLINGKLNGIYYCPNNTIIDGDEVLKFDKNIYLFFDYFIIDFLEKRIKFYDKNIDNKFVTICEFESIEIIDYKRHVTPEEVWKFITIKQKSEEDIKLTVNEFGIMINNDAKIIRDNFLAKAMMLIKQDNDSITLCEPLEEENRSR